MKRESKSLAARISKAKDIDGGNPAAISLMEAAARLRLGRSSMQRLVREKKVRSFKIGRALRIPISSLDDFITKSLKGKS